MLDRKTIDLINKDLDDVISAKERVHLSRRLAEDSDARAYREEMKQVSALLQKMPDADPPENMKKYVMNTVRARAHGAHAEESFVERLKTSLTNSWLPGRPFAFVLGLLAGIVIYAAAFSDLDKQMAPENLGGTISPTSNNKSALVFPVALEAATGTFTLECRDDMTIIRSDIVPSQPLVLEIGLDPLHSKLATYELVGRSPESVQMNDASVRIALARPHQSTLTFESISDGKEAFSVRMLTDVLFFDETISCTK